MLRKTINRSIITLSWQWFYEHDTKNTGKNIDNLDFVKMKNSLHQKAQQIERWPVKWRKYFANPIENKRLMSKIYKRSTTLQQGQNEIIWFIKGQSTWVEFSPENIYNCPIVTKKDAQHHYC